MSQIIVGAGLAGLIAACHFKDARVIDAAPGPVANHQALLRFRNTSVSELTGIPFKKVTVQKAVFSQGDLKDTCSIRDANQYSYKVSGGVRRRSITNLEPEVRYIAPDDFFERLVEQHKGRIDYGTPFNAAMLDTMRGVDFISTAPMSVNLAAAGVEHGAGFAFSKASITVLKVKLAVPSEVYQTVYFPEPSTRLFRASITGDTLIIEILASDGQPVSEREISQKMLSAFGILPSMLDFSTLTKTVQPFGKIVDLNKGDREAIMHELTAAHRIFSLGRFATWRNILLDDVVNDIESIDHLIKASAYGRKLILSKQK